MFLLSLVSFWIFLRIVYYMSLMKSMGEKKPTFLTTVMNLWVVGMRDWALSFVCNRAIYKLGFGNRWLKETSLIKLPLIFQQFDQQFIVFSTCIASMPAVSGYIRVVYCLRLLKDSWYASSFLESLKRSAFELVLDFSGSLPFFNSCEFSYSTLDLP